MVLIVNMRAVVRRAKARNQWQGQGQQNVFKSGGSSKDTAHSDANLLSSIFQQAAPGPPISLGTSHSHTSKKNTHNPSPPVEQYPNTLNGQEVCILSAHISQFDEKPLMRSEFAACLKQAQEYGKPIPQGAQKRRKRDKLPEQGKKRKIEGTTRNRDHNEADKSQLKGDHNSTANGPAEEELISAAVMGREERVRELLDQGVHVDARGHGGCTAILGAASVGQVAIVEALLVRGAQVNLPDRGGCTAIYAAVKNGHARVVELLADHNANIHLADFRDCETPLHVSALKGRAAISLFLLQRGADVHARDFKGYTPLHHASVYGHLAIVKQLLEHGSLPDSRDNQDHTPTHAAALHGHDKVNKKTKSAKAKVNNNIL